MAFGGRDVTVDGERHLLLELLGRRWTGIVGRRKTPNFLGQAETIEDQEAVLVFTVSAFPYVCLRIWINESLLNGRNKHLREAGPKGSRL